MNRTLYLHGKINPAERRLLELLAEVEQVNLSEALRIALREAGHKRGLWPLPEREEEGEAS